MSRLTLAQANKIVEVALAKAREMKIKPLAVAVLDEAGHVKSLQREDDASMLRNDVAIGKAWAAVGMGVASRTLLAARQGQSAVLRRALRDRPGQVHSADRRGGDQGQGRQLSSARPGPRAAPATRTRRSAWRVSRPRDWLYG